MTIKRHNGLPPAGWEMVPNMPGYIRPKQQSSERSVDNSKELAIITKALKTLESFEHVKGKDGKDGAHGMPGAEGPQGPAGRDGKDGAPGKDGRPGRDGKDGRDGRDGVDGKPGPKGERGPAGPAGKPGKDGKDGKDGVSIDDIKIHGRDMIIKDNSGKEKRFMLPTGSGGTPFGGGGGSGGGTTAGVTKIIAGTNVTISPSTGIGEVTINAAGGGIGAVDSVNGQTGTVVLTAADVGAATTAQGALADTAIQPGDNADLNAVSFDTTPSTLPTAAGSMYWDAADGNKTVAIVMEGGNVTQQIGQETYYRIKASSAITEGQVVMATGTLGASGAITGAPATGLTPETGIYVIGVATENIALNDWGYVTSFGLVRGIDATGGAEAWTDGTVLYYNPAVAGGLTKTVPTAPNAKVVVAMVVHAASNGSLFIRPSWGSVLGGTDGNVQFGTLSNNDFIVYNGTNSRWENKSSTDVKTALGLAAVASSGAYSDLSGAPSLATVATTGAYSDLSGTPTLGTAAAKDVGVANGVAGLDAGGTVPTSQLPAAVLGAVKYQGAWNASTNSPTLTSSTGTQGYYYVVGTAGSTNLDGITDWKIGDWAIYNGTAWQKIDNTDAVTSVNGYTGAVSLTYTDVSAASAAQGTKADSALQPADIGVSVQAYDADLTSWAGKTAPTGDVVGTTDAQTLSGKTITGTKETKVAMAANDVDLSAGNYFTKTISGITTLTVSNTPTTGTAVSFILDLTNGGSAAITWWSGMKWAGGTAPTLTASGRDVLGFFTHDGGTTWTGLVLGKDVK